MTADVFYASCARVHTHGVPRYRTTSTPFTTRSLEDAAGGQYVGDEFGEVKRGVITRARTLYDRRNRGADSVTAPPAFGRAVGHENRENVTARGDRGAMFGLVRCTVRECVCRKMTIDCVSVRTVFLTSLLLISTVSVLARAEDAASLEYDEPLPATNGRPRVNTGESSTAVK